MEITAVSAIITIIIEALKRTKLISNDYMAIIAIGIGLTTTLLYLWPSTLPQIVEAGFYGITLGASAVGLYEGVIKPVKNLTKK